jgi:CRP/FNR family cyclic AMP-dependent transcriptional regulator
VIPTFECPFDFELAAARLLELTAALTARVAPIEVGLRVSCDTVLSGTHEIHGDVVYIVREGGLHIRDGEKLVMIVEEGEVVSVPPTPLVLSSPDFAVVLDLISTKQLKNMDGTLLPAWAEIERFQGAFWLSVTASLIRSSAQILPQTRVFSAGSIMIEQGSEANEVFTLLEGEAEVFVDGVKVGEVKTNEFFGILASVTKSPRTARVVARTPCAVLVVDRERFQELIQARPVLVEKLIFELGRMVVDLNSRVVTLSKLGQGLTGSM